MNNSKHKEVPPEKLRWQCDPNSLDFKTTDELKSTKCIIGQERALKAIKLGLEVKSPGYNIYVAGLTGCPSQKLIILLKPCTEESKENELPRSKLRGIINKHNRFAFVLFCLSPIF